MLLPQGDGFELAANCESSPDNINSLVEYIDEIVLDNPDRSGEDQDSDQDFHYAKQAAYNYQIPETRVTRASPEETAGLDFGEALTPDILPVHYDIIVPPPKA